MISYKIIICYIKISTVNMITKQLKNIIKTYIELSNSLGDLTKKFKISQTAINDQKSFDDLGEWLKQLRTYSSPDCKIFLIGNKADLTECELLKAIKDDKNTKAFVFYLESLKYGQEFLKIAREVNLTKPIVVLEPGKSSKAQAASLSHTGSLAPNYRVL